MAPKKKDEELGELSEAQSKFLSAEHKNLFFYQRSLIYDAESLLCFSGPDAETAQQFLVFCSDPARFVCGAGFFDAELRPRVNLLQTELPFADCFGRLCAEARARLTSSPNRHPDVTPFQSDVAVDVMAELAAIFIVWQQVQNGLPPKGQKEISRLVGLLRAKKAALVSLKADDFKEFKGRSLVSLILKEQQSHTESYVPSNSNKRERDETSKPPQQHKQQTPKKTLKNPILKCTTCNGNGHETQKCCIPHQHCMPSWRCFGCSGSGHSLRYCPSEYV